MGTLMDSTSKRLVSAIRGGESSASPGQAASPGARYHGGYQSGGGTWGRAATGRGQPNEPSQVHGKSDQPGVPQRAPTAPLQPQTFAQNVMRPSSSVGRRQRIRPNSAGAFSTWDTIAGKDLPKCAKGTSPRLGMRPNSATARPAPYSQRALVETARCTLAGDSLSLTSPLPTKQQNRKKTVSNTQSRYPDPEGFTGTTSCKGFWGGGGASGPPGPRAFADPYAPTRRPSTAPRKLSTSARDPASILAVLERGLTITEDREVAPGHESCDLTATAAAVSPPHEHVAHKLQPGGRPPRFPGQTAAEAGLPGEANGAAGGEGGEMTVPPYALAGLMEEEHRGAGEGEGEGGQRQATLREQLAGAALVGRERVRQIEQELAAAVKRSATVYVTKEQVLQKVLREVDSGMGELGVKDVRQVAQWLGVQLRQEEALALFTAHGFTTFLMPVEALHDLILPSAAVRATADAPAKRRPFAAGAAAGASAPAEACKLTYRPCKTPVFTPTRWPAMAQEAVERSSRVPDARLRLEFVYGYAGFNTTSCNLFYNCNREVVYYVAAVAVVYTPPADSCDGGDTPLGHTQRFFLGHDDDIRSLALCPAAAQVDATSYPANALVATGQVTSTEHGPYIAVWDSRAESDQHRGASSSPGATAPPMAAAGPEAGTGLPELRRIELEKDYRGIGALAFSPDGKLLVAVALDNVHSVIVFDWREGVAVSEARGFAGEPPQVFGATWNPHVADPANSVFVTWGKKHCKLWWPQADPHRGATAAALNKPLDPHGGSTWACKQLSFGRFDLQNVHSAAFLPVTYALVLGLARGDLLVFDGNVAVRSIAAHHPGPQYIAPDGSVTYGGLRGLALHDGDSVLLTAGADGTVKRWTVKDGVLGEKRLERTLRLESPYGAAEKPPAVRALCVSPLDRDIMVGTAACDIWEVHDAQQEVIMYGNGSAMHAVAWHPVRTAVFASASDAPRVFVCDANARSVIKTCPTGMPCRSAAWSPRALRAGHMHHLALGGAKGRILVLDEESLRPITDLRDGRHAVHDLKYNPAATVLAAACADRHVELYAVGAAPKGQYVRVARCAGHSAAVRTLDWSADGAVLQSACAACELLCWDGRTGRQVRENQRDTRWATWTSVLGFPVMGVWYSGADATDVNAVCRDESGRWLAAADDRGLVRLLAHPCVVEQAPSRGYVGHSAHVTCVRFNAEVEGGPVRLLSCGGADRAVFQFDLEEVAQEEPEAAPPEPVWAALDEGGKVFGWTTAPVAAAVEGGAGPGGDGGVGGTRVIEGEEGDAGSGVSDEDAGGWDADDVEIVDE
eukprot:jgi/Ulvmu1/4925/UM203_0004.1